MPRIYNFRHFNHHSDAIRCDRKTKFGNQFIIGKDGNRNDVCDKYEKWIWEPEQLSLREQIMDELKGKDLICWCYPERCHCETLMLIANAPDAINNAIN